MRTSDAFKVGDWLVEPKLDIVKEYYLGVTIDRANYNLVLIGSPEGGVDIEETADIPLRVESVKDRAEGLPPVQHRFP